MNNRDYTCPLCGGWLELVYERWVCDTCDYDRSVDGINCRNKDNKQEIKENNYDKTIH